MSLPGQSIPASGAYPPAPWRLTGEAHVSFWLIDRDKVASSLPPAAKPFQLGPRCLITTGWVKYTPPGILAYHELLFSIPVRSSVGWGVTIPLIWVDSPASLSGGRELWHIPKQLAEWDLFRPNEFHAAQAGQTLATFQYHPGLKLPGSFPGYSQVIQPVAKTLQATPFRGYASFRLGRGVWQFPEGSPLHFLATAKPFLTVELAPVVMDFGA